MRHDGMQEGIYVEHVFSRGLLKCWPVDKPEDEPNRASCAFLPKEDDLLADWYELPARPRVETTQPPGNPVSLAVKAAAAGWGAPVPLDNRLTRAVGTIPAPKPPAPAPGPRAVCEVCDYAKNSCICPKPDASKWGQPEPKKDTSKWGTASIKPS